MPTISLIAPSHFQVFLRRKENLLLLALNICIRNERDYCFYLMELIFTPISNVSFYSQQNTLLIDYTTYIDVTRAI